MIYIDEKLNKLSNKKIPKKMNMKFMMIANESDGEFKSDFSWDS